MSLTSIEWTWRRLSDGIMVPGYTFNIVWGCTRVSEGCKHCYADTLAKRYGFALWGPKAERRTLSASYWQLPLKWQREAARTGHRRNVFCCSMADVFEDYPVVEQERVKLWPLIEQTPMLNWLLLTKRPQHVLSMVPYRSSWPDNVWVGTSVENQWRADERLPSLLKLPAVVRFLSCEPLLEQVNLSPWLADVEWVIVGGESGGSARPMAAAWATALRDQCRVVGVPYFFKQWGGYTAKAGGRLLDGREWNEMPAEVCSRLIIR